MNSKKIIFRIDDIGTSSKKFEVYSKFRFGNFLFLKYFSPFAAWGPYEELTSQIWNQILSILKKFQAKLTVAITACWVGEDGTLIPFPDKFPKQAAILKNAAKIKLVEIANHGLTHCVVGKHKPRFFSSNRNFHREFWDWVPAGIHYQNIEKSQNILQSYFGKVLTFVPPGNVWTKDTERAAAKFGLKYLCCQNFKTGTKSNGLIYVGKDANFAFHDRDINENGIGWLTKQIGNFKNRSFEITSVSNFFGKL